MIFAELVPNFFLRGCLFGRVSKAAFDHEVLGIRKRSEAEFGVDAMGIAGGEEPVAGLEVWMVKGELNKVTGETLAAVRLIDPNVAEVSEADAVGDDAQESGLCSTMESAEDEAELSAARWMRSSGMPGVQ